MGPKRGTERQSEDARVEWPQLVSFALLVGAILTVLIAGAVLRTPPPGGPMAESRPPSPVPEEVPEPAAPDVVPAFGELPPPDTVLDRMASRSSDDLARLASDSAGWTAQLGVFCDAEHVAEVVDRFGELPGLLVLPSYVDDRPCFRICWSRYASRGDASRAGDMPASLRGLLTSEPLARPVTEVLE
jgi:hypothetical protein